MIWLSAYNALVNSLIEKALEQEKGKSPNQAASPSSRQLQASVLNNDQLSVTGIVPYASLLEITIVTDINSIINSLLEKRKVLEAEDQSIEVEVMLNFLMTTKNQKQEVWLFVLAVC